MRQLRFRYAALTFLVLPSLVSAQPRGRTDGPEGSEYGKGGYSRSSSGQLSAQLDFGGALTPSTSSGTPLVLGATLSYWIDDWFILDGSGSYLLSAPMTGVLVGPRLRTGTYPVSAAFGLKAGAFIGQDFLAFGLSPQLSLDVLVADHVVLALTYSLDVPVGVPEALSHRLFMSAGYRF